MLISAFVCNCYDFALFVLEKKETVRFLIVPGHPLSIFKRQTRQTKDSNQILCCFKVCIASKYVCGNITVKFKHNFFLTKAKGCSKTFKNGCEPYVEVASKTIRMNQNFY